MDAAKYRTPSRKGPACTVGLALTILTDDLATFLRQLIDDPLVPHTRIEQYSEEDFGLRLPATSVARHARGECQCG